MTKTTAQPPVTKPIHETKLEIVTEPFVPKAEKASPPKIVKQPLRNRRRPRSPSDAPRDRVDATPRSDRAAHPRVVVHENVVRRSVNLETGQEEIEVLATGELAVERFSRRPARNRTVQSGNVTISTDARGRVSTQHRRRRTKLYPFLRHGRSPPPGIPAVAAPWPYRAAFLGPPLCHWSSRPRKTPCRGSGGGTGRPLAPIRHT